MTKAALRAGCIEFAHHVDGIGIVFQRLITMRKALSDVDTALVPGGEFDRDMPQIGG